MPYAYIILASISAVVSIPAKNDAIIAPICSHSPHPVT